MEILLTLIYAILLGAYNIFKKLSVRKTDEAVVLVFFTTFIAILSCIWIPFGVAIPFKFVAVLAFKGLILAISWFTTLKVLKSADLSIVGATRIISAVLSFLIGIFFFKETTTIMQVMGSIMVVLGVFFINLTNKKESGGVTKLQFVLLLMTALIGTISGTIDKYTSTYCTPQQLQFWFLIFVAFWSWCLFGIDCIRHKKFEIKKSDFKNFWIYFVGLTLFLGDICLFSAYKVPGSKLITITIISSLKNLFVVLGGIIVFKEKNVKRKLLIGCIIILGAILISIG